MHTKTIHFLLKSNGSWPTFISRKACMHDLVVWDTFDAQCRRRTECESLHRNRAAEAVQVEFEQDKGVFPAARPMRREWQSFTNREQLARPFEEGIRCRANMLRNG